MGKWDVIQVTKAKHSQMQFFTSVTAFGSKKISTQKNLKQDFCKICAILSRLICDFIILI